MRVCDRGSGFDEGGWEEPEKEVGQAFYRENKGERVDVENQRSREWLIPFRIKSHVWIVHASVEFSFLSEWN